MLVGLHAWGNYWCKCDYNHYSKYQAECPTIHCIHLDLTDWDATKAALDPLPAMAGLVNNAAVAVVQPFLEVNPEDFDL